MGILEFWGFREFWNSGDFGILGGGGRGGGPFFFPTFCPPKLIEPAEPEPPPAHSIGSVGGDVMGRSGQLIRPCWFDAGSVAGGEQLVAGLVVRLARASFFG